LNAVNVVLTITQSNWFMKKRYFLLFIVSLLSFVNGVKAQLVTDNVFLSGKWLQVAISPNGSWGNTVTAPAGYYCRGGSTTADPILGTSPAVGIDFSYDQGHDGFAVGAIPYYGSYCLPGTPFDGWSMQVNGIRSDAYYTSLGITTPYRGFYNATVGTETGTLHGSPSGYSLNNDPCWFRSGSMTGTWSGQAGPDTAIKIHQVNRLDTNASWLNVSTKFINTSDSPMHGVYYFVSADPDNDELLPGGSFPTDNHIAFQDFVNHRHEVNAVPDPGSHHDAFSGLVTRDCRAKATIYNGWPPSTGVGNDLDLVWAEAPTGGMCPCYYLPYATTISQDIAYGLIFNLGDIPPHDSVGFSFAWIFSDSTAIDSAFNPAKAPYLATLGTFHDSLDTVVGCNLTGCGATPTTFLARIIDGDDGMWANTHWTWSPATALSGTAGTSSTINMTLLTGPTTYTITGTRDGFHSPCAATGYPATKTFLLHVVPCFNATNNSLICFSDTLKLFAHGDSTGASYFWYGPGGFTGFTQYTRKNPMLSWADTGWYYVVRTVGSVHDTAKTHVLLKPLPLVTAGSNSPVCSGAPNVLNLTATAFDPAVTFSWTGPNAFISGLQNPSRTAPPVADGGLYKVVTTLNGCTDSGYTTVVIDSTPAVPTVGSNSPICSKRNTLLLTASDVTPGVTYTWGGPGGFTSVVQNPSIPPDVPVGASGVYTVTVTLSICSNSNMTIVTVDKTPDLPVLTNNGPLCSGNALKLFATSDPGSVFRWTGPNGFTSGLANPIINPAFTNATGNYFVTATIIYPGIPAGCTSDVATMPVLVDSVVIAGYNYAIKYGCKADTVVFNNTSVQGSYFKWYFGDGTTSIVKNPTHIYPIQNIDTVILVSMAGVCRATDTQVINLVHPLQAIFRADTNLICQGSTSIFTNSSIATTGPTGILPGYLWMFGDGNTSNTFAPTHTYPKTGTYKVMEIVTDFVPCHDTAYEVIYVDSLSPIHMSITDTTICRGTSATFAGDYTSIGNTGVVWDFGNGDTVKDVNPVKYSYTGVGVFTITATARYRVCAEPTTTRVVTVFPQPSIFIGNDTTICKGSVTLVLKDQLNASNNRATWLWSTGATTPGIGVTEPGKYTAKVTIDGCYISGTVEVKSDCYMNIPNVFTPNGDGLNDYFFPRNFLTAGLTSFSMQIFNRWGELIFQTTALEGSGWDGKFNNMDQPSGVYVYVIDGTFKDGQKEHHQGNVTLLR
jgi:gliding motility-associated-like protein